MPGFLNGPVTGFTDRSKGRGVVSSSWLQQIGNSAAQAAGAGNIAATALGTPVNPGAINSDNVLAVWTLPANLFSKAGVGVMVTAMGSVANNTNAKRIKIYWGCTTAVVGSAVSGGVVIADSGAYAITGAAGWSIEAQVFKYGAPGSNTQLALHQSAQIGATVGALITPSVLTSVESSNILVAITGNAATALTDIAYFWGEIFATN